MTSPGVALRDRAAPPQGMRLTLLTPLRRLFCHGASRLTGLPLSRALARFPKSAALFLGHCYLEATLRPVCFRLISSHGQSGFVQGQLFRGGPCDETIGRPSFFPSPPAGEAAGKGRGEERGPLTHPPVGASAALA